MSVPQRSIYLLNQYNVQLTEHEYVAILIHDGWILPENQKYIFKEPLLATVLMHSDYISSVQEKIIK